MLNRRIFADDRFYGHLMFLVLFVLAIVLYLPRTIFVDPCYAIFNVLYYRDYVSEAFRYTAVYPQTLALLGMKLNLSLRGILLLYSVSFILLYYIVYLIVTYIFRQSRIALAIPLLLMLGIKYSFFWISTETHQALVYTVLFYCFLNWSRSFRPGVIMWMVKVMVATGILLLAFYAHPVSLFTVLFVLGYFMIDRKMVRKPDVYILGAIIITLSVIKFMTGISSGYESFYFKGFSEFFDRVQNLHRSESLLFLNRYLFNIYFFSMLIFLSLTGYYVVKRLYIKLFWFLGYSVAFALILFTTFDIWYFPFIQEKNLMGLNILLLIPFLNDVRFRGEKPQWLVRIFISLAFLTAVYHVVNASFFYRHRLDFIQSFIQQVRKYPEKKFVIPESVIDREQLNVNWAFATETLILSSLEGPDSSVSIYINDPFGKIKDEVNLNDTLLFVCAPWAQDREIRRLNPRYFNLSNSVYRVLTEEDLVSGRETLLHLNRFDDPVSAKDSIHVVREASGNYYYLLSDEFSPGFYGEFSTFTREREIRITARARVMPLDTGSARWLGLVITREKGQNVLEYYNSTDQRNDTLKIGMWNSITVAGILRPKDPEEVLKVYLWNPGKKYAGLDDIRISYTNTGR